MNEIKQVKLSWNKQGKSATASCAGARLEHFNYELIQFGCNVTFSIVMLQCYTFDQINLTHDSSKFNCISICKVR